jgi:hypothetical protein
MKPVLCFEVNKELEEAARAAEERKVQAIDRLNAKLSLQGEFDRAMHDLIDADKWARQEKGK